MSSLHHVVHAVADVHQQVEQKIVTLKHQGPPIKLQGLGVVINHLDVEKIDTTGAAELRQEKEPESERRAALSRDGNDDVFTLLPPLTKPRLEAKGMHTQSLRPADDDSIFSITGALVPKDAQFRRQVRQFLLLDDHNTTLMNQELSDILAKTFNLKNITSKSNLHGVFSFQIIHIAMVHRIFSER